MNLKSLKKKLREQIHVSLRTQAEAASPDAALTARDIFLSHFHNLDPAAVISLTLPIKHELDTVPLMKALHAKGHQLALPVIVQKGAALQFRAYKPGDALVDDVWGIRHPLPEQPVVRPDLVICPFLAFDRAGRRLGYGGGYYDASLAQLRAAGKVTAVGFGFAVQEVEQVPAESRDQRLDCVITEKEAIIPDLTPESGQ